MTRSLHDTPAMSRRMMSEFDSLLAAIDAENQRCAALECALLEIRCLLELPAEGYRNEWNSTVLHRIRSILAGLASSGAIDP